MAGALWPSAKPEYDETPISNLARNALLNHQPYLTRFCTDMGIDKQSIADCVPGEIQAWANLLGVNPSSFEAGTIRRVSEQSYWYRGEKLVRTSLRRNIAQACPICLANDIAQSDLPAEVAVFGRAHWLIAPLRSCLKHGFELVEFPRGRGVRLHDFASAVRPALQHLPRLIDEGRFREPTRFELYLGHRLSRVPHPPAPFLDRIEFHAVARICEMLGVVLSFGPHVNINTLTSQDRSRACEAGFEVAVQGEERIRKTFEDIKQSNKFPHSTYIGPQAVFGRFYQWLASSTGAQHPGYGPIRHLLREYIVANFALSEGADVLGTPLPARRFHTIHSAGDELGIPPKKLKNALMALGNLPKHANQDEANRSLFDAIGNTEVLQIISEALSMAQARKYLGVNPELMTSLHRSGFIKPFVRKNSQQKICNHLYSKCSLDQFLSDLYYNCQDSEISQRTATNLLKTAQKANRSQIEVIKLKLSGKLRNVWRRQNRTGIPSLLFDASEVCSLLHKPQNVHTVGQVAEILRSTRSVVRALIEEGIFSTNTIPHAVNSRSVVVIPAPEVAQFRREICTIFDLARETGVHYSRVKRAIQTTEIEPTLRSDRFTVDFYRRSELASIAVK